MSHYTVLVVTENGTQEEIESALAPFDENLETEPHVGCTMREALADLARFYGDGEGGAEKSELWRLVEEGNESESMDAYRKLVESYYGIGTEIDGDGNVLSTANDDAKWDWYEVGGRWAGGIPTAGGGTSSCRVGDIDFSPDEEVRDEARRWWEVAIDGQPLRDGEDARDFRSFYSKDYMRGRYRDADGYADTVTRFGTHAVLDLEGNWHEPGEIGWFGVSDATDESEREFIDGYERLVRSQGEDAHATLVDCHI